MSPKQSCDQSAEVRGGEKTTDQEEQASDAGLEPSNRDPRFIVKTTAEDPQDARNADMGDEEAHVPAEECKKINTI